MDNLARKYETPTTETKPGKKEGGSVDIIDIQEARRKRLELEKKQLEDQHAGIIGTDPTQHGEQKGKEVGQKLENIKSVLGEENLQSGDEIVQREQSEHQAAAASVQERHRQLSDGLEETALDNSSAGVRNFSKRYSSFRRSEVASEILRLRRDYREGGKQTSQQNAEVGESRAKISEEIEATKTRIERLEKVIAGFEDSIREQKSKIWYKITSLFKKKELDDERMLGIAQGKLEKTREEIQEKQELLDETREVIFDSSALEDAKTELKDFYQDQSDIKSTFEHEREQRDLARISKEKGTMFIHGLPLDNFEMNNTSANNSMLDTGKVDVQAKIQMILGLEPTLSTSTVNENSEHTKGMMYPFGVILKGGTVLSAYRGDAGTEALGLHARKSKYDKNLGGSVLQKNVSQNINEAIENPLEAGVMTGELSGFGYNEIVVENPKVSGLYVNLDNPSKLVELSQIKVISENLGLPVFGMKDGKMLDLINGGKEISLDEILNQENLSLNERVAMTESSIEMLSSGSGDNKAYAEAKRKLEALKKEKDSTRKPLAGETDEPREPNLLDAKGIEERNSIAGWVEKLFSSPEYGNGDDLVAAAVEQLKGEGPVIIRGLFSGKTKEEVLEMSKRFRNDREKLNRLFENANHNLRY